MNFKLPPTIARRLLAIGLLSSVLPNIINDLTPIPDFFRGAMLGAGLGLEIIGIIILRKSGVSSCSRNKPDSQVS